MFFKQRAFEDKGMFHLQLFYVADKGEWFDDLCFFVCMGCTCEGMLLAPGHQDPNTGESGVATCAPKP